MSDAVLFDKRIAFLGAQDFGSTALLTVIDPATGEVMRDTSFGYSDRDTNGIVPKALQTLGQDVLVVHFAESRLGGFGGPLKGGAFMFNKALSLIGRTKGTVPTTTFTPFLTTRLAQVAITPDTFYGVSSNVGGREWAEVRTVFVLTKSYQDSQEAIEIFLDTLQLTAAQPTRARRVTGDGFVVLSMDFTNSDRNGMVVQRFDRSANLLWTRKLQDEQPYSYWRDVTELDDGTLVVVATAEAAATGDYHHTGLVRVLEPDGSDRFSLVVSMSDRLYFTKVLDLGGSRVGLVGYQVTKVDSSSAGVRYENDAVILIYNSKTNRVEESYVSGIRGVNEEPRTAINLGGGRVFLADHEGQQTHCWVLDLGPMSVTAPVLSCATAHPNPSSDMVHIDYCQGGPVEGVRLYDVGGYEHPVRWQSSGDAIQVDVSACVPGVYSLALRSGRDVRRQMITVVR